MRCSPSDDGSIATQSPTAGQRTVGSTLGLVPEPAGRARRAVAGRRGDQVLAALLGEHAARRQPRRLGCEERREPLVPAKGGERLDGGRGRQLAHENAFRQAIAR